MFVVATAGHVDHGKSTLIERLTGIDPDRLAEEKRRGLTIDLGFAWLELPDGPEIGIVDVPGHERFVSNMLAGVGSVDATIFVVAANEGWKPQSEEHLAILDLLGARAGVVALTKSDLVEEAALPGIAGAVTGRLEGTTLAGAPVVPVSPPTGSGIDTLVAEIARMLDRIGPTPDRGRPRLFVDRSFSIKGAGTVVTGTLTGGRLRVDDDIAILPGGGTGRIRSIQTHKRRRDEAEAGSRVALNLGGVERDEIARGDAIVKPGAWRPATRLDVSLRAIRGLDHAVHAGGAFKLHLGSAEVDARVRLLDTKQLRAGEEAYARVTLAGPVLAEAFDRFVLRDTSRSATVAGGVVLDAHPVRARLAPEDVEARVAELRARREAGLDGLADAVVAERGAVANAALAWLAGAEPAAGPLKGYSVSAPWLERATSRLGETLRLHHEHHPLERGMPREDARAAVGIADAKLFAALVEATTSVTADGPLLRLTAHRVRLDPDQQAARDRILAVLDQAAFAPPTLTELAAEHGQALVSALVEGGDLVRFSPDHAFTRQTYERAKQAIAGAIVTDGPATAARLRDVLGTSRKYLIPLLEHLDAEGFTERSGDRRSLAGGD